MIGPFALACLDMAGTTVRDDGAVEAAFTSALAAVGITPGSRFFEEAQVVVRQTMGWSKADVFASLLDQDEAREATAAFAAAYEAIVAAGEVSEIPGALQVLRDLRAAGVRVCLTTGFAPSTRDALLDALDGAPRSTWPCRRPMWAGAVRRRISSSAPWPASAWTIRSRWRWWATPAATSRRGTPPVPGRSSES